MPTELASPDPYFRRPNHIFTPPHPTRSTSMIAPRDQGPFIYQLIQRPGFLLRSGSSIPTLSLALPLTLSSIYLVLAFDLCCVESVKAHKDAVNIVMVSEDGMVSGFADKQI